MSSTPCSIFISYNHSITPLAEDLHTKLTADGFMVVRDVQVGYTENFTEFMKKIRQTDYALLLINEPYLKSINCMFEITEMLKDDEYKKRILPLVMEGTEFYQARQIAPYIKYWRQENEQIDKDMKDLPAGSATAHIFDAKRIARILTDLDVFLNELWQMRYEKIPLHRNKVPAKTFRLIKDYIIKAPINVKTSSPQHWNLPHRQNPNFTGREDILKQLRESLISNRLAAITAVHGLGGVGKTQAAIEYVYRYRGEYEVIWWVRSEQPISMASDYAGLAAELNLPEKDSKEQAITIEAVKQWFGQHEKWLLVFDNVQDPKARDISTLLPQGAGGHVIITSRNPNWRGIADPLKIKIWDKKESIDFIIKRAGIDDFAAAAALAEELGNLPLALEQACAYIEARGKTIKEYISLYQLRQKELLTKGELSTDYPDSVATTWSMAFENLSKEAAGLLNICSFMAPDEVPWNLFSKKKDAICSQEIDETIKTILKDPLLFDEAVESLRKYSLIELQDGNISLHRLVQAVTRDRLAEKEKKRRGKDALTMIRAVFPDESWDARYWPECKILAPHAITLLTLLNKIRYESKGSECLLDRIAIYVGSQKRYAKTDALFYRNLSIYEQQLGDNHPDLVTCLYNLALLHYAVGMHAEAETLFRRNLSVMEQQLGENHPDVATSLNDLARLLQDQGKYAEAEPLYHRSLKIREKQVGENHQFVAQSLDNLAGLLRKQGRYAEAEPLYCRSLSIYEQELGENHPVVAIHLNDLARFLQDQGKYAEAEPLYRRSLCIYEQQGGKNHPTVATSLNYLALLFKAQGKYAEAEPLFRRSLSILEQREGDNDFQVVLSLCNLAGLLHAQGKYTEAEPLCRRSLSILEQQLGENHPHVATSLNNLALLLYAQGKYAEAEPLYRRSLSIREQQLGENHPVVATSLDNLANLLYAQGKYAEAEPLFRRAVAIAEEKLGSDHPNTVLYRKNLKSLLEKMRDQPTN